MNYNRLHLKLNYSFKHKISKLQQIIYSNTKRRNFTSAVSSADTQVQSVDNDHKKNEDSRVAFKKKLLNGPNLQDFFKDDNLKPQDHLPDEEVSK